MSSTSVGVLDNLTAPLGPATRAEADERPRRRRRPQRPDWGALWEYVVALLIDMTVAGALMVGMRLLHNEVTDLVPTGIIPRFVKGLRDSVALFGYCVVVTRILLYMPGPDVERSPVKRFVYAHFTGRRTAAAIWIRTVALAPVFAAMSCVVQFNAWVIPIGLLAIFGWQVAGAFLATPRRG